MGNTKSMNAVWFIGIYDLDAIRSTLRIRSRVLARWWTCDDHDEARDCGQETYYFSWHRRGGTCDDDGRGKRVLFPPPLSRRRCTASFLSHDQSRGPGKRWKPNANVSLENEKTKNTPVRTLHRQTTTTTTTTTIMYSATAPPSRTTTYASRYFNVRIMLLHYYNTLSRLRRRPVTRRNAHNIIRVTRRRA